MRDSRKNDNYKPNAMIKSGNEIKAKYDAINFKDKAVDDWNSSSKPSRKKRKRVGNTKMSGLRGFGQIPKLKGY